MEDNPHFTELLRSLNAHKVSGRAYGLRKLMKNKADFSPSAMLRVEMTRREIV